MWGSIALGALLLATCGPTAEPPESWALRPDSSSRHRRPCYELRAPSCGRGDCIGGHRCRALPSGTCACVPHDRQMPPEGYTCHTLKDPVCRDGTCPPGQECLHLGFAAGDCGCVPMGLTPCGKATPLVCDAYCPPDLICAAVNAFPDAACMCVQKVGNCHEQTACAEGSCPPRQACTDTGLFCACLPKARKPCSQAALPACADGTCGLFQRCTVLRDPFSGNEFCGCR